MYDDKFLFQGWEAMLLKKAKEWRSGPNFKSTISGFDNTPFEQFEDFKARATFECGVWLFKVIARWGYSGVPCTTLAESFLIAIKEREEHRAEIKKTLEKLIVQA